jgi:hypothetical protein
VASLRSHPASVGPGLGEQGDEGGAAASDPGPDSSGRKIEDLGYFGVVEATKVAQDHGGAEARA